MDFATLFEDYFILPPSVRSLTFSGNDLVYENHLLLLPSCNHFASCFRRDLDVVAYSTVVSTEYQSACCFPCFEYGECISSVAIDLIFEKNGSCLMLEVLTCLFQINSHGLAASISRVVHQDHMSIST